MEEAAWLEAKGKGKGVPREGAAEGAQEAGRPGEPPGGWPAGGAEPAPPEAAAWWVHQGRERESSGWYDRQWNPASNGGWNESGPGHGSSLDGSGELARPCWRVLDCHPAAMLPVPQ